MAVLSYECLLLFKRTGVQLPEPKSGSMQQPVTPVPGDLTPFFWSLQTPAHTWYTYIYIQIHIYT